MIRFGESGHPVFRATSPLSRGTLESKGGGKLSVHFCADGETIETVFRTIMLFISTVSTEQSQICVMNTIPAMLEQGDPCWQDNLTHCSSQQVCWWQHLHLRPKFLHKKISCKCIENERKGSHNKIVCLSFVLTQDSCQQLKLDSTSWQRTLKSSTLGSEFLMDWTS